MPISQECAGRIMSDSSFSEGEKFVLKAQLGALGGFERALWDLVKVCDLENLKKLALAFPGEVAAYRSWSHGDLGDRFRAAGAKI